MNFALILFSGLILAATGLINPQPKKDEVARTTQTQIVTPVLEPEKNLSQNLLRSLNQNQNL